MYLFVQYQIPKLPTYKPANLPFIRKKISCIAHNSLALCQIGKSNYTILHSVLARESCKNRADQLLVSPAEFIPRNYVESKQNFNFPLSSTQFSPVRPLAKSWSGPREDRNKVDWEIGQVDTNHCKFRAACVN